MSKKVLHIDSSILGKNSVSRLLSSKIIERLTDIDKSLSITYRDLAADPIPHLSGDYLEAAQRGETINQAPKISEDLAISQSALREFLAADIVVIGVAFYNFSISSQLKSWIDRIAIPGQTFKYTESGPIGLAGEKRVILAISRGGFYGQGSPSEPMEHAESYLRSVFLFMGISSPEIIVAEGINISQEQRQLSIQEANKAISRLPPP